MEEFNMELAHGSERNILILISLIWTVEKIYLQRMELDILRVCGFVVLSVITKWKSYFPVQNWCQTDCSWNLLLLQPRDCGSVWRFNSLPEPLLNSAAIKKSNFLIAADISKGAARVWHSEDWRSPLSTQQTEGAQGSGPAESKARGKNRELLRSFLC